LRKEERQKLQKKLLIRHYTDLLEPDETRSFRSHLLKTSYSLLGSVLAMPYIVHTLLTYK
jgi:hypothetical protein